MCYFCTGSSADYQAFLAGLNAIRSEVLDVEMFLSASQEADKLRFASSPEWSETPIATQVGESIFRNPDPAEGLLLFILTAWLDLQAPYVRVWNHMLVQAQSWLHGLAWSDPAKNIPRGNFPPVRPHMLKTIEALSRPKFSGSAAAWFVSSILNIALKNGPRRGNTYRFVSSVCQDLYEAKDGRFTASIAGGELPFEYMGTHYKRLWMLMMFLRRDQHVIRCLLRRATASVPSGEEAFAYWINDLYFDPLELELPVDARVRASWQALPFVSPAKKSVEAVAREARRLARDSAVSPASFDAILFF